MNKITSILFALVAIALPARSASTISIAWDPATNGVPVTNYVVEYQSGSPNGPWIAFSVGVATTATVVNTNDASGTMIRVTAEGRDPLGNGLRGVSPAIFVPKALPIGRPTGLVARAFTLGPGTQSVALLSWSAVSTGNPTGYVVEWRRGEELTWRQVPVDGTSVVVTNDVDSGVTFFRVSARNATTVGLPSAVLRITRAEVVIPPTGLRTSIVQFSE